MGNYLEKVVLLDAYDFLADVSDIKIWDNWTHLKALGKVLSSTLILMLMKLQIFLLSKLIDLLFMCRKLLYLMNPKEHNFTYNPEFNWF